MTAIAPEGLLGVAKATIISLIFIDIFFVGINLYIKRNKFYCNLQIYLNVKFKNVIKSELVNKKIFE